VSTDLHPPGLDRTLGTDERAEVLAALLAADAELEQLVRCTKLSRDLWPDTVTARLRPSPVPHEPLEAHLKRWSNLFADEVQLVHETRNRVVHQVRVSDSELLRAHWLARHLLSLTNASSDEL
jgi:hypothetical protein